MKRHGKKSVALLLISLSFLLLLSIVYGVGGFYLKNLHAHNKLLNTNLIEKSLETQVYISEVSLDKNRLFLEYSKKRLRSQVECELKSKVNEAYTLAHEIYHKQKHKKSPKEIRKEIMDALSKLTFNTSARTVYIKDFKGNTLLDTNETKENIEYRDITLESLQQVRKEKSGYLEYRTLEDERKLVYVKDLDIYEWFIGSSLNLSKEQAAIRFQLQQLFESVENEEEYKKIVKQTLEKQKSLQKSFDDEVYVGVGLILLSVVIIFFFLLYLSFHIQRVHKLQASKEET